MPERFRERRRFPRPPFWLNVLLIAVAAVALAYGWHQRDVIEEKTAFLFKPNENRPEELSRMREELAQMDLTQAQLRKELEGRMEYVQSLQGSQFYLTIDTATGKMQFRLGRSVVRECDVQVGAQRTIKAPDGRTWTFLPLKGGFNVVGKAAGYAWPVSDWVFYMKGTAPPVPRPVVPDGLGRYIIVLPNNYIIHSPPSPESPLQGPKPGSFMAPEQDLAAIWPRIDKGTLVYIF